MFRRIASIAHMASIAAAIAALSQASAQDAPQVRAQAQAQASPLADTDRAAIEAVIADYLLENPEIIEEAIMALQAKRLAEQSAATVSNIADNWDALAHNDADFSIGPADAPVTIVEFFDYNCGYCKSAADYIQGVIDTHGDNVRVVFKETPIFQDRYDGSTSGAKAALAAMAQDKYLDMHFALMANRGVLDDAAVNRIAKKQGVRMRWLTNAMAEPALEAHLQANLELGAKVGLRGTPYFIVNDQVVSGADFDRIDALIAQALEPEAG